MTNGSFPIGRRGLLAGFGALLLQPHPGSAHTTETRRSLVLRAVPRGRSLDFGPKRIAVPGLMIENGPAVFETGDDVTVSFHNGLAAPAVLSFRGLDGNAAAEPLTGRTPVAPGATDSFAIELGRPGTLMCDARLLGDGQKPIAACAVTVREQSPPQADREETWLIEDWRLAADNSLAAVGTDPGSADPVYTINARPRIELAARPRERIRFRFINGCQRAVISLKIDGHDLRVMAIDGCPAEPFLARDGQIVLAPGNRVDAMVDTIDDAGAAVSPAAIALHDGSKAHRIATLAVAGTPVRDRPLDAPPASKPVGLPDRIDLRTAVRTELELNREAGRHSAWIRPADFADSRRPAFRVRRNRVAVIALVNRGTLPVTFVLHGHHFRLLDRLDDGWKPFWLDTLVVGPQQTQRLAFRADHSGDWLMEAMAADWSAPRLLASYQVT